MRCRHGYRWASRTRARRNRAGSDRAENLAKAPERWWQRVARQPGHLDPEARHDSRVEAPGGERGRGISRTSLARDAHDLVEPIDERHLLDTGLPIAGEFLAPVESRA